ncbi:site-specific integrase [Stenotrophomonas maltophilia]|jgi:integrase|nr:site-specific integrase [Stenotrophomonas maltophilia]
MTPTPDRFLAEQLSDLPELPETVLTKDRQELSTQGDIWWLRANSDGGGYVSIDFRPLMGVASTRFIEIVKRFVARKARTYLAWSLANIAFAVSRAVRYWSQRSRDRQVDWSTLRIADFQALLSYGLESPQGVGGNDFAHLRAIYAWGVHVARLTDFDPLLALQLKGIKAPGNMKGRKVLGSNPEEGSFTPEEVELLDKALKRGVGDPKGVIIAQLFQELGLRPIQVLRTRWSGLRRFEANVVESGETRTLVRYVLSIPRAKEQGEHRVEEDRPISALLGERLDKLKPSMHDEATPLCWWLDPDTSSKDLGYLLQGWVDEVGLVSPRTGDLLKANPSRFRYTLATEAARDGASRFDIAHLLFHVDLQNVEVYFDAAGTVMDQIEERLEKAFGNHLNRFQGKLAGAADVSPYEGLERRVVPGVFPQLPEAPILQMGLGACGHDVLRSGICKLAPPITCYRCPKFAAFREVDHKAVGDALEAMARSRFDDRADDRIGGGLVLTIQAIRDLERQIAEERGS